MRKGAMPELPQEILVDILSRLPVKSLGQFKSVSRYWHSLISDSRFVKLHLGRVTSDPTSQDPFRIMAVYPFHSLDYESPFCFDPDIDYHDHAISDPKFCVVIGSCNGLICLIYNGGLVIVWNPAIKESMELPFPPDSFSDQLHPIFTGFGYDASIDDYKIVRAVRSYFGNETKVEAFSLVNNSWHIVEGFDKQINVLEAEGIFLNGALHWLACCATDSDADADADYKSDLILSFDLAQETFKATSIGIPNSFYKLGTLDGRLSLLCDHGNSLMDVEVWVMKEYGFQASWTRLVILPAPIFNHDDHAFVPLCSTKNGELIVELDGRKLLSYNLQHDTAKRLKTRGIVWFIDAAVYVESLVSLRAYNEINHQQLGSM